MVYSLIRFLMFLTLQDILSCVGGVQLIFPLLEAICTSSSRFEGQLLSPQTSRSEMRPAFLRSHYTSDVSVGIHEGKLDREMGRDNGDILLGKHV